MQITTTRGRLNKTPVGTPLAYCSVAEPFNATDLNNCSETHYEIPMSSLHLGSGYNLNRSNSVEASMSSNARVFVLSLSGKPLTPCKPKKAKKMILGGVAVVVWNKFGEFGIKMLVETRENVPKTILGVDWGTKFEGLSVVSETENNLNVMWLLPNKKVIVHKLKERRQLRRARRFRNCRRREARFNNRSRKDFIAPSQKVMMISRLKAINEIMKCYPIKKVVIEDVKFNHKAKKWGKNFSTIEVGKNYIYAEIKGRLGKRGLKLVKGYETFKLLKKYGLRKNRNKSQEEFYTHCVDSFVIASEQFKKEQKGFMKRIGNKINDKNLIVVDDTYRAVRRRLHDSKFSKGGVRPTYSSGSFKGIRKGTLCELGQICGGTDNYFSIYPLEEKKGKEKRIRKSIKKINWLSHQFKRRRSNSPQH